MKTYLHVVENAKRNGEDVYILMKTYKTWYWLMRYVLREGTKPCWLIQSQAEYLTLTDVIAEDYTLYWNSGSGWNLTTMPALPLGRK